MHWTEVHFQVICFSHANWKFTGRQPQEELPLEGGNHRAYWQKQDNRDRPVLERIRCSVAHFSGRWDFFLEISADKTEWDEKCGYFFFFPKSLHRSEHLLLRFFLLTPLSLSVTVPAQYQPSQHAVPVKLVQFYACWFNFMSIILFSLSFINYI